MVRGFSQICTRASHVCWSEAALGRVRVRVGVKNVQLHGTSLAASIFTIQPHAAHASPPLTCLTGNHVQPLQATAEEAEDEAGSTSTLSKLTGTVRVFDRNLHARMPLDPTHVRLKLLHACDQWHSSRVSTSRTGSHGKLRPNTAGKRGADHTTSRKLTKVVSRSGGEGSDSIRGHYHDNVHLVSDNAPVGDAADALVSKPHWDSLADTKEEALARCSFPDRMFSTSPVLQSFTPLLRLKHCHACNPMACPTGWIILSPIDTV